MQDKIELELVKIINSFSNNYDLVHLINYLFNTKILNKNEQKLCNEILNNLEITNMFNLDSIFKKLNIDINESDYSEKYSPDELFVKSDAFVAERKACIIKNLQHQAFDNSINGNYDKETVDFIYNRYSDIIKIKDDNTFDELVEINENQDNILTAMPEIDSYLGGLVNGTITTIVGSNNVKHKNILSLNIAYNAIKNGKNVLYLSIGNTKKDIYKKLLVIHSCDEDRFEKLSLKLSYNVLNNKYGAVYDDFKDMLLDNIIVLDEKEFYISTHYSLLKVICDTDKKFKTRNNHGIDLIIIDDLSCMKLFDGKKFISNKNTIANEFYSILKNQSISLLNSGRSIPILATYEYVDMGNYNLKLNVPDIVSNLSDNIIVLSCDLVHIKTNIMNILIYKNSNNGEIMDIPVPISCDYEHWYINKELLIYGESDLKSELEEARKDNNKLLFENQAYVGNNNVILRKIGNMETSIDEIKNKLEFNDLKQDTISLNQNIAVDDEILTEFNLN